MTVTIATVSSFEPSHEKRTLSVVQFEILQTPKGIHSKG